MKVADLMLSRAKAPSYQGVNGQGGQPGFSSFGCLPQGFWIHFRLWVWGAWSSSWFGLVGRGSEVSAVSKSRTSRPVRDELEGLRHGELVLRLKVPPVTPASPEPTWGSWQSLEGAFAASPGF